MFKSLSWSIFFTHGDKLLSSTGGSKAQVFSTRHPTGREWVGNGFRVPFSRRCNLPELHRKARRMEGWITRWWQVNCRMSWVMDVTSMMGHCTKKEREVSCQSFS